MDISPRAIQRLENVAQDSTLTSVLGSLGGQITRGLQGAQTSVVSTAETSGFLSSLSQAGSSLVKGGVDFAGSLATGTARLSQLTDTAANALGSIGAPLGAIGGVASDMLKFAEGSVDSLERLSASGASFNNNILQMNYAASQSRLTLDEFAGMVQRNSEQLVGLGGSVTKGANTFANMSKTFFDDGLGDDLINMGFTFEEVNDSLMNYMETNRRTMDMSEAGQLRARQAAAGMAKEMDMVAKLTGVNRKEMEADIQKRMRSGQVQAKLRLLEMSGNKEAAEGFRRALAEAQKAGPDAVAALEETFTKGTVVSDAGRRGMVALGEAGNELTNVVNQINAGGAGVGPALDQFNAAVVERVNSRDFLQMATLGGMGGVADAAASVLESAGPYADAVRASSQGAVNENASRQQILEAVRQMETNARAEQTARDGITQTLQMADARMKDVYASIGTELYGPNGIATDVSNSDAMQRAADTLDELSRSQIQTEVSRARNAIPGVGNANSRADSLNLRQPEAVTVTPEQRQDINQVLETVRTGIAEGSIQGANETSNILTQLLTGPNAVAALEALEASNSTLGAAETAVRAIQENNVGLATTIRDIVREQTTTPAMEAQGIPDRNAGAASGVVDALTANQLTTDAVNGGQYNVDNFTVSGSANLGLDQVVQTVRDIRVQAETAQTEFGTQMGAVNTQLTAVPPAIEQVSESTRTGLESVSNSLSTNIQELVRRVDALIEGQTAQTRAITRTGTNLQ